MTKNLQFPRFMVIFMSYYPQFYGSKVTTSNLRPDIFLTVMSKNTSVSCFMTVFMSYCPHLRGSMAICMVHNNTPYMSEKNDKKIVVFTFYGRFHELLPTV